MVDLTCPNCCGDDVALVDFDGVLEAECNDCDFVDDPDQFAWRKASAAA